MPYLTTGGTKWLHKARPCTEDAACVKKLRSGGAIFAGKTNLHELGVGTSGINPQYGPTRNSYNINRVSGGSSSGSAAAVCAGVPLHSVLMVEVLCACLPLCGVVGFKPTAGRFPSPGVIPLNWTIVITGILAGTVEDVLIVYAAIANDFAVFQPKSLLWFNDSSTDIKSCCDNALQLLSKHYGWKTVDVTIPEIEEMRLAHYVTMGSESTTYLGYIWLQLLSYPAAAALPGSSCGKTGWPFGCSCAKPAVGQLFVEK